MMRILTQTQTNHMQTNKRHSTSGHILGTQFTFLQWMMGIVVNTH